MTPQRHCNPLSHKTQAPSQSLSHKDDYALLPASRLHSPSGRRRTAALHKPHGLSQVHTLPFFLTHPSPLFAAQTPTGPVAGGLPHPQLRAFQVGAPSAILLSPPSTARSRPEATSVVFSATTHDDLFRCVPVSPAARKEELGRGGAVGRVSSLKSEPEARKTESEANNAAEPQGLLGKDARTARASADLREAGGRDKSSKVVSVVTGSGRRRVQVAPDPEF